MEERLGGFEELVLLAVAALRSAGYGVSIQQQLEEETGHAISLGAVYTTLDRLERKGLVASKLGAPTAERGGKPKRLYRVTAAGSTALVDARRIRQKLWSAIESPARP